MTILWVLIWVIAVFAFLMVSLKYLKKIVESYVEYDDTVKFSMIIDKEYSDGPTGKPMIVVSTTILKKTPKLTIESSCDLGIVKAAFGGISYTLYGDNIDGCKIDFTCSYSIQKAETFYYSIVNFSHMYFEGQKTESYRTCPDLLIISEILNENGKGTIKDQKKEYTKVMTSLRADLIISPQSNFYYSTSSFSAIKDTISFAMAFFVVRQIIMFLFEFIYFYMPIGTTLFRHIVRVKGSDNLDEILYLV